MPDLNSYEDRQSAIQALERDFYAASSAAAVKARRRLYIEILSRWSREPFPASSSSLQCLGAGFKAGKYRSAPSVMSQYRVDAERSGQTFTGNMLRMVADVNRS